MKVWLRNIASCWPETIKYSSNWQRISCVFLTDSRFLSVFSYIYPLTNTSRVGCLKQPTLPLSIRINMGSLYGNVSILNYKRDKDNVSYIHWSCCVSFPPIMTGYVADLSWKSGARAIEKLDRLRSTLAILSMNY